MKHIRDLAKFVYVMPDGRQVPFAPITCMSCWEIWFVNATSNEYLPICCPYCGVKTDSIKNQEEFNS